MKVKPFSFLPAIGSSIYKITQKPEKPKLSIWQPHKIGNIDNPEVAIGDTVLYKEFSGTELEFEGKNLLLVPYSDILGKVVETGVI